MQYQNNFNPYYGTGIDPYNQYNQYTAQPQISNPYGIKLAPSQAIPNPSQYGKQPIDPRAFETPTLVMDGPIFGEQKDEPLVLNVGNLSDAEVSAKKKRKTGEDKPPKKEVVAKSNIVRETESGPEHVTGEVVESSPTTIYSYYETNGLLHETLGQIDAINSELVQEFNAVRHNRTMKNKYNVLNALSENIGSLLNNRISAIKEINNCISKSNDLDYKKYKDMQAAQSVMSDDKYIADLYQAFMKNPQNTPPTFQTPNIDQSIFGSSIIRANIPNNMGDGGTLDEGYLSYIANLTPEQNLMRYENNPNVKQVVVYDAATGNKFFQMMDMSTMEAIPNVPTYDLSIMEDTTLDLRNGIAKNLNLKETFPIVQINNSVTSQY